MKQLKLVTIFISLFLSNFASASVVLKHVESLVIKSEKPVVIFDLDDTLFYSSSRSLIILHEAAKNDVMIRKYPEEVLVLGKIKFNEIQYSIKNSLSAIGVKNKKFIDDIHLYWKDRFFTNEYVQLDRVIEGSVQYVNKLARLGARIVYLTGRDNKMRLGTIQSLIANGFPYDANKENQYTLITKDRFETSDIEYKKLAFKKIEKLGNVVSVFENEPKNINAMVDYFKRVFPVFLDVKKSPEPTLLYEFIINIKNYL